MAELHHALDQFLRGDVDINAFTHEQHVRMGFELLSHYDFAQAAHLYSRALRTMAERAGKPQAFHQTITIAFLSLIAERRHAGSLAVFTDFAASNPDLLEKSALSRWYRPERLASDIARRCFVLPDSLV